MHEVHDLLAATSIVMWDREIMMPPKGEASRTRSMEALSGLLHERRVAKDVGKWLRELHAHQEKLTPVERTNVVDWHYHYERLVRLPVSLTREMARVTCKSYTVWVEARKKSNFRLFAPWFAKVVKLCREQSEIIGYRGSPYDVHLDDYCPRMTVADLSPLFQELKIGLIPLAKAVRHSSAHINNVFAGKKFPIETQEKISRDILKLIGLFPDTYRLDRSVHPFCSGKDIYDIRISNRYDERMLYSSVATALHEGGHGLYAQGHEEKYIGTPMGEAVGFDVHESQSRLWENFMGRSRPFVAYILPRLKKYFSTQLRGVNQESFYQTINRVSFYPIRVESDELTYNLHIILRFELERALMEGDLAVRDLPGAWNEKTRAYLGFTPKNDAQGVLQDVHWAWGNIGYFPSYAMGNLYAAQLWHKMRRDFPRLDDSIRHGKLLPIRDWLRQKIHRHGRRYSAMELIMRATGSPPSPKYLLDYVREKFGDLYDLR